MSSLLASLSCSRAEAAVAWQVINYGFSDIGPWTLLDPSAQSGDMIMRMMSKNSTTEKLQYKIDEAVKKIAAEAYELALQHIRSGSPPSQHISHTHCSPLYKAHSSCDC